MRGEGRDEPDAGAANRGSPASLAANGEVLGSGAGAGGGGGPEEIDSDSAGGAATNQVPHVDGQPNTGADASSHGSR